MCKLLFQGILEALEHALKDGFKPQRTFYLAFGHDEEVSKILVYNEHLEIQKKKIILNCDQKVLRQKMYFPRQK